MTPTELHFPNPHPLLNKVAALKYRDKAWNLFPCTLVELHISPAFHFTESQFNLSVSVRDETDGLIIRFWAAAAYILPSPSGISPILFKEWYGFKTTNSKNEFYLIWGKVPRLCKCGHPKAEHNRPKPSVCGSDLNTVYTVCWCGCFKFIRRKRDK